MATPYNLFRAFTRYGTEPLDHATDEVFSLYEFWDFTISSPAKNTYGATKALCMVMASTTTNGSGVATIYLTDDKTITGNAVFTKIVGAFPASIANVSPGVSSPQANVQAIPDNKTISITTTKGQTNLLGLTTSIVPAANINVNIFVICER